MKHIKLQYALLAVSAMAYQNISPMDAEAAEAAEAARKAASDATKAQSTKDMLAKAARERELAAERTVVAKNSHESVLEAEQKIKDDLENASKNNNRESYIQSEPKSYDMDFQNTYVKPAKQLFEIYNKIVKGEPLTQDDTTFIIKTFDIRQGLTEAKSTYLNRIKSDIKERYTWLNLDSFASADDFEKKIIENAKDEDQRMRKIFADSKNIDLSESIIFYSNSHKTPSIYENFINWVRSLFGTDSVSIAQKSIPSSFIKAIKEGILFDRQPGYETSRFRSDQEMEMRKTFIQAFKYLTLDERLQVINKIGSYLTDTQKADLAAYLNIYVTMSDPITLNDKNEFILKKKPNPIKYIFKK